MTRLRTPASARLPLVVLLRLVLPVPAAAAAPHHRRDRGPPATNMRLDAQPVA